MNAATPLGVWGCSIISLGCVCLICQGSPTLFVPDTAADAPHEDFLLSITYTTAPVGRPELAQELSIQPPPLADGETPLDSRRSVQSRPVTYAPCVYNITMFPTRTLTLPAEGTVQCSLHARPRSGGVIPRAPSRATGPWCVVRIPLMHATFDGFIFSFFFPTCPFS